MVAKEERAEGGGSLADEVVAAFGVHGAGFGGHDGEAPGGGTLGVEGNGTVGRSLEAVGHAGGGGERGVAVKGAVRLSARAVV